MIGGASAWLLVGALLLASLGMLVIPSLVSGSRLLSRPWGQISQVLGVLFLIGVLGLLFEVDIVFQLIAAVGSVIVLPAWALWLDRQVAANPTP